MNDLLKLCHDHAGKSALIGHNLWWLLERDSENLSEDQIKVINRCKALVKELNDVIDTYYTAQKAKQ